MYIVNVHVGMKYRFGEVKGSLDGWTKDEWTNEQLLYGEGITGWIDGQMDGQMNGWTNEPLWICTMYM